MAVDPETGEETPEQGSNTGRNGGIDYDSLLRRLAAYFGGAAGTNRQQNNLLDQRRQSQWKEVEDARLARDRFAEQTPGIRANTSLRASLTNNFQPTRVNWGGPGSGRRGEVPTFDGGFAGGMTNLDPRTRQLNDTIMSQELDRQMSNKDAIMEKPPPLGQESAMDRLLGGAAAGSGLLNALGLGDGNRSNVDIGRIIQGLRDRFSHSGRTPRISGHFDRDGNWITDSETDRETGYFDEQGNWITDPDQVAAHNYNDNPDPFSDLPGYGTDLPDLGGGGDDGGYNNPDDWYGNE